ncbi:MAG: hypothetical protein UZ21_OP11001000491 [Microgenomates bacterium OLB22]|nr:MAG: hypothetical protein UZ21_OP11001000491 [Microgenomates bacterium OLB22]
MRIAEGLVGRQVALWTGLLLAINPYHLYFSQEYRMYAFFGLLVTASWLLLLERRWKSYALSVTALIFTHYFAGIVLLSQLIWVLLQRKVEAYKYIQYAALGALPFALWIRTFLLQLRTSVLLRDQLPQWSDVLSETSTRFIPLLFIKLFIGILSPEPRWIYGVMILTVTAIMGTATIVFLKNRRGIQAQILFVVCWVLIPITSAWLISFMTPVASLHRFAFIVPGLCIGLAILIASKQDALSRSLLMMVVAIFSISSLMYLAQNKYQREDWRTAVSFTDNLVQQSETAGLVIFPQRLSPFEWYSQTPEKYIPITIGESLNVESISTGIEKIEEHKRLVIYRYLSGLTDPEGITFRVLKEHGYKEVTSYNFRGVGIVDLYIKE